MRMLLLLWMLLSALLASAREPSLYFEKITVQNGLSHNKVNCILQDQRGFIWLGTDDGLNRFDGKRFLHFRSSRNDSTKLSGNIITDLLEDREGRIWIATADGGLVCYDHKLPPQQQFRNCRNRIAGAPPVYSINTLLEDPQGYLWLGTSGHDVIRYDKKKDLYRSITTSSKTILDLCLDSQGMIWVGRQGGGIMKINPLTLSYSEDERYADFYASLPHVTVTALFKDRQDEMWFGSWDKVLYRYHPVRLQEEVFSSAQEGGFQNDEALSFAEDRLGRIWIGGKEKGLQVFDRNTGKFHQYSYDPSREGSISDNRVNCLFIDRQGRVWLGTNKGVCINNPDKQQFRQTFLDADPAHPLTIYDFYEDEKDQLWIGSSRGLFIKTPDQKLIRKPLRYKGHDLHITQFFRGTDGVFYLGTDYSLFVYEPATQSLRLLPNTESDGVMDRIIDSRVVSIVHHTIDGRPVLMTAPYGHFLTYYDLLGKRWVSRLDSSNILKRFNLKDNLIRRFYQSRDGNIWIATGKAGLGLWQKGQMPRFAYFEHDPSNPASLSNNNVYDLAEDAKGNLWVSTYGGGLNYFEINSGKFTQIAATNNLVEGIRLDLHGNVWMISNGHLQKYDPRRRTYSSYELPDLEKTGGVRGRIFSDRRGRFYLAGLNYFISFHPDSIRETKSSPQVFLTDFQIFNRSFSHLLQQEKIRLNYKDNYFAFEFAAPHFSDEEVHYAYKLEGFDQDWIDAGNRNYVSYPNLEGGNYVFKVRATTTPGVWTTAAASVNIEIIPPYWKKPWFYLVCALLLGLATYLIYRYRINELVKRQAIRNKIAQDLHDNVGSTLSSISIYSQVARIYHNQHKENELHSTLEKISTTSSEMISELNDTVWAINPRNDNMFVILQRMESFARPLLAAQGIQFSLEADPQVRHLNLEMEKRKNFYLIFKEAINNAVKYAACRQVQVRIRQKGNILSMMMQDDGKGFDLAKTSEGFKSSDVYGGGNGLKNMQLRAREMKGLLTIHSEAGKGTEVELQFPIT